MNNRELVDYILSNKLQEDDVIKEIVKYKDLDKVNNISYIYNDGVDMWDDNDLVSILRFCDDNDYNITYSIITEVQAELEIEEVEKKEKIKRLKRELKELENDI